MRWDGEMEAIWLATANSDLRSEQRELEAKIERLEAENFRLVAENERLRTLVDDYENSICWETTCINCAKLLDDNYDQYCEIERLMNAMELAWGLIANGQYWDRTDGRQYGEWNDARLRWRDEHWHPALDRNREARRG